MFEKTTERRSSNVVACPVHRVATTQIGQSTVYTLLLENIEFHEESSNQRYRLLEHEDLSFQIGHFQVYQYQGDSLKAIRAKRLGPVLHQSLQMATATHIMYEKPARHRAEEKSSRTTQWGTEMTLGRKYRYHSTYHIDSPVSRS